MSLKTFLFIIMNCCFAMTGIIAQPVSHLNELKSKWIKNYNQEENQFSNIANHYLRGGSVFLNDIIFHNNDEILNGLKELKKTYPAIEEYHTIDYYENDPMNYIEMGKYSLENQSSDTLYYIIAWKKVSDEWLRELEVIYPKITHSISSIIELSGVDKARRKWVDIANKNIPRDLVYNLYTRDATYFNNTKVSKGQNEITSTYSFMSNPNWKMKDLVSKKSLLLQPSLVFDVGVWQMENYSGLYTLVWKLTKDEWKAVLDFNF